jgi:aspartyl-tRNA(Asn)/glutamyl-tRNA(Gln) amidotransferase subunit B
MRSKEHAHDYRYFPEPDLLPLQVSDAWRERLQAEMPELPSVKRERFVRTFGLREYDAQVLTQSRDLSDYFERVVARCGDAVAAAKWVQGDLMAALNAAGTPITESPVPAEHLGELVELVSQGELTGKLAKEIFPRMFESGAPAREIAEREGLKQIRDSGELERIVAEIVEKNPKQVEQYRGGKTTVLGFFVGQVMKATRGQANPQQVNQLLAQKLGQQ